jgi:hypothetical protein
MTEGIYRLEAQDLSCIWITKPRLSISGWRLKLTIFKTTLWTEQLTPEKCLDNVRLQILASACQLAEQWERSTLLHRVLGAQKLSQLSMLESQQPADQYRDMLEEMEMVAGLFLTHREAILALALKGPEIEKLAGPTDPA